MIFTLTFVVGANLTAIRGQDRSENVKHLICCQAITDAMHKHNLSVNEKRNIVNNNLDTTSRYTLNKRQVITERYVYLHLITRNIFRIIANK